MTGGARWAASDPRSRQRLQEAVDSFSASARASKGAVNLVPSETRLSPLASLPLRSDFYNRYFFNDELDPGFWQFRGGQDVSWMETDLTLPTLRSLGNAPQVSARPVSGLSAMLVALAGLGGDAGNVVLTVDMASGGHYATASIVRRLGLVGRTVSVERGVVDEDALLAALGVEPISLVYLDLQNSLHRLDVGAVAATIARVSPSTLLHVDVSHTLGLVLGGAIANPLDQGADSFGGSTHKSFPGPQKGVLFTRRGDLAERLREAQFFLLSSHHFAATLALGLAAAEFTHFGKAYAEQVTANARSLGRELRDRGFEVIGDEPATDTHQLWVRIGDATKTDLLSDRLYRARIRVNVQVDLPGAPGPMFRLGVNEITFEGANDETMALIASAFESARDGRDDRTEGLRAEIRSSLTAPYFFTDLAREEGRWDG